LLQHKLELCSRGNNDIIGTMTVSLIFRPVDTLCHLATPSGVGVMEDNVSLSSYDSRGSVMKKVCFLNCNILYYVSCILLVDIVLLLGNCVDINRYVP